MGIEDHIINTVRTLKSAGESLIDLATKVANEVTKDNKPEEQKTPDGASSKPVNEEIPGWVSSQVTDLATNGVFRFAGSTFQLIGGSVHVRNERGELDVCFCARALDGNNDRDVYFHPLCKVLAPKK